MIWTVPNLLTFARIVAAPCVALTFLAFDRPFADWIAFFLFTGAAVTDFCDGWLARRLRQESLLGKMLDPIADKAMVIIALAVLMGVFPFAAWLVLPSTIIFLREILISGLREFLGDVKLHVTWLAKWKTAMQMSAISLLFLVAPIDGVQIITSRDVLSDPLGLSILRFATILLWLAAALTALSGFDYLRKGFSYIQMKEQK